MAAAVTVALEAPNEEQSLETAEAASNKRSKLTRLAPGKKQAVTPNKNELTKTEQSVTPKAATKSANIKNEESEVESNSKRGSGKASVARSVGKKSASQGQEDENDEAELASPPKKAKVAGGKQSKAEEVVAATAHSEVATTSKPKKGSRSVSSLAAAKASQEKEVENFSSK